MRLKKNRSGLYIACTSPEEDIFLQGIASDRADNKKSERLTVSGKSKYSLALQAIASEYLVARSLGLLFDPSHFRGRGDGHRRDLWRGPVTVSLKTRGPHLPSDFIFPPGQNPGEFPDDYGIVGRWVGPRDHPYSRLELVGYFTSFDWEEDKGIINLTNYRTGVTEPRDYYPAGKLRPLDELIYDLEKVTDAKIRAIQDRGYEWYFGHWYRSGRYPVL